MANYEYTGPLSFGGFKGVNLAPPTAGTDAVTKTYADALRGVMLTASSVGTRPASPLPGQEIYRTDKGFVEQWDGGAWRVPGVQTVAALTDIQNPITGQMAILSSDAYRLYYYNGQWLLYGNAQRIGGEWAANAQQNLPVGTTKLQFPTATVAGQGLTFNGTDTWTIQSDGVYDFHVNVRRAAASTGGDAIHVTGTTYADGTLLLPGPSVNGYGETTTAGSMYLTTGTQICAFYYNGAGASNTAYATRPPKFRIWKSLSH